MLQEVGGSVTHYGRVRAILSRDGTRLSDDDPVRVALIADELDPVHSVARTLGRLRSAAAELIESGRSGCLAPPDPGALASAIRGLARRRAVLGRLATGGLLAARRRSPERSLGQLARGYAWTLGRVADDDAALASEVAEVPRAAARGFGFSTPLVDLLLQSGTAADEPSARQRMMHP